MKVAQKNPTNPNTRSVHLSHALSMLNMEHSPSVHLSDTGPEPGTPSRLISPLRRYHLVPRLGTPSLMLCRVMHRYASVCIVFIVSSPSSLRYTTRPTSLLVPRPTTLLTTPPSCQSNQTSPPDHQISPILLYTACIRVV